MTHELHAGLATLAELLQDGLRFLRALGHSRTASAAEILFLSKQLAYYQEHQLKPRRITASRLSMLLWSRFFDWKTALVVVKPDTFIRWHRRAFKWYWRWKSAVVPAVAERHRSADCPYGERERDLGARNGSRTSFL
jgi:hypothetical protein